MKKKTGKLGWLTGRYYLACAIFPFVVLAVVGGVGLGAAFGADFNSLCLLIIFVLLGVGVDDTLVITDTYDQTIIDQVLFIFVIHFYIFLLTITFVVLLTQNTKKSVAMSKSIKKAYFCNNLLACFVENTKTRKHKKKQTGNNGIIKR